MPKYFVRYVEGWSSAAGDITTFIGPSRHTLTIEAKDRVNAYIKAHQQLAQQGNEVTVIAPVDQSRSLLGFTPEEIETVRMAGIPITAGFPKVGVQIEEIICAL